MSSVAGTWPGASAVTIDSHDATPSADQAATQARPEFSDSREGLICAPGEMTEV